MGAHGDRAIVLGGSMAGLLAARVLAERYRSVVVVERDTIDGTREPRRGVPQGRHAHSLHGRGQTALEELFPGLTAELAAAGAPVGDLGEMKWYFDGRLLQPTRTGLTSITAARPVLEAHVRARVAALPGVTFLEGHEVVALHSNPDHTRVLGARVRQRAAGAEPVLHTADLVVDATGRGSRTPARLREWGYPAVPEETVKIGLAYTTRHFRLRRDPFRGLQSINPVATPAHPRGAFFGRVGADQCILSLTGILGDHPPTDDHGFLEFTRSLPVPEIHQAVHDAEPLDDAVSFTFPASVRRRWERLPRLPEGLLVVGDAVCSFNPVYGQGMIVAALEAMLLRRHLLAGPPSPVAFLRDVARVVDPPWDVAAGGDLAFPEVQGRRGLKVRLSNAYLGRLQRAATADPELTAAFLRVAGLVEPPLSLMRPPLAWRVLTGGRSPVPAARAAASPPLPIEGEQA